MTKVESFVNRLTLVLEIHNRDSIKSIIGDSTNNNRTLTVNQVIRFLNKNGYRKLAAEINALYFRLNNEIRDFRNTTSSRTDAIDVNEFLTVVECVGYSTSMTRSLAQVLSKAA